jgi:hypothetical protein
MNSLVDWVGDYGTHSEKECRAQSIHEKSRFVMAMLYLRCLKNMQVMFSR